MNTTPRLLNRAILAVAGLAALAAGSFGILLLLLPGAATWWGVTTPRVGAAIAGLRGRTTLEGQADTWLWIVLAAILLVTIVLLVLWISAQGRGRTGLFASTVGEGAVPGSVTITAPRPNRYSGRRCSNAPTWQVLPSAPGR
ncbi:hypothetical protein GM708_06320 [Vibrio cholerae]|nr:hypothetical protein [Vibrio cholerae]